MRRILTLGLLLLCAVSVSAAPPPDIDAMRIVSRVRLLPAPQLTPPIQFWNQSVPIGVSFIFNCSTNTTCAMINGVMTLTATGGAGSGCTPPGTANSLLYDNGAGGCTDLGSLGTTTTVLHGNAAGLPTFSAVVSADLNITPTTCTNQFLTVISAAAAGTCSTASLASAQFANQGTTTTVLHGNGAGNPAFGAVVLSTDVSGQLPIGSVGSAGLSGTSPVTISAAGAIGCATCNTSNATVSSVATTAPITGGTITTTGTIACATCATTTNGGALSGTAPVTVSAAGAIGCATCVTSAGALTSNAVVIGGGLQASSTISADSTTTHALFATAGAPAFRAIASGDLPTLSTTPNGQTCTIGSTCNVNVGATAHSVAINQGNGSAITGVGAGTTGQILRATTTADPAYIDFPDVKEIPAANCNNATGGNGWSIGSGGTVSCRAGTNNLGGFVQISDVSSTFATFQIDIPVDWDTASLPFIRVKLSSSDATNAHTVIPSESVACYVGDGSGTDDIAQNATRSLSTVTLNGVANRFWSTSNLQFNSTDMTNCVGGSTMQVTIGRATDTATAASVRFYSATITFPRLIVVQAN